MTTISNTVKAVKRHSLTIVCLATAWLFVFLSMPGEMAIIGRATLHFFEQLLPLVGASVVVLAVGYLVWLGLREGDQA